MKENTTGERDYAAEESSKAGVDVEDVRYSTGGAILKLRGSELSQ